MENEQKANEQEAYVSVTFRFATMKEATDFAHAISYHPHVVWYSLSYGDEKEPLKVNY